jgi:hypothetical protein
MARIVPEPNNHTLPQPEAKIEISLNRLSQLFNSFDPSPFHERDLDQDAEDYIIGVGRGDLASPPTSFSDPFARRSGART